MANIHEPNGTIFVPDDVLSIIFSALPMDASLIEVAQACSRFKALVMPILYRNIRLEAKKMEDSDYSSLKPGEPPPGLLPETLSLNLRINPEFCRYVRKLSLKVQNVSWYENAGGYQRLITSFPSIQEITLKPPPKRYNFSMSNRLTTMNLDFSYDVRRFWGLPKPLELTPLDLSKYLSKPTLRKLQFEHIESLYYRPASTAKPGSSAVTDLRFIDWLPHEVNILKSVLPSIRYLRHFVLEVNGVWGGGRLLTALGPHDYGLLLQPHSTSLEELSIAYSNTAYCHGSAFRQRASPFMGTLTSFHNLNRLALPEPFLVSLSDASFHKLLPPQLQELQIQYPLGDKKDVLREGDSVGDRESQYRHWRMQKLAKNKETFVPRLKYVVWWFQQTSRQVSMGQPAPFDPEEMNELARDFEKVGVRCQWVSMPCFKDTPFAEYLRMP